jgi:hypothetical protein
MTPRYPAFVNDDVRSWSAVKAERAGQRAQLDIEQITAIQLGACEGVPPKQVAADLGLRLEDVERVYYDEESRAPGKVRPRQSNVGFAKGKRR